jgi:hypothetical protein
MKSFDYWFYFSLLQHAQVPANVSSVDDASKLTTFDLYDDIITDEGLQHQTSIKEVRKYALKNFI